MSVDEIVQKIVKIIVNKAAIVAGKEVNSINFVAKKAERQKPR